MRQRPGAPAQPMPHRVREREALPLGLQGSRMSTVSDRPAEVLVVGAGPTGLVLALWLKRLGVDVRIIDKIAEPGTTSRALAVHARTLELYDQLDLAQVVLERGHKVPAIRLWVKGEP